MLKSIPVLTSDQLKQVESDMGISFSVPKASLMECAGLQAALWIQKLYPEGDIFILLGKGGNGGDGMATARHLFALGRVPTLIFLEDESLFKDESLMMYQAQKSLPLPRRGSLEGFTGALFAPSSKGVVVDAVFGSGFKGPLKEPYLSCFRIINESDLEVVSLDVPSGQVADFKEPGPGAIRATHTLAFGFYRLCHVLQPARSHMGRVELLPIGHFSAPGALPHSIQVVESVKLPPRRDTGHKNTFGHVLVIGGSRGMVGAPILTAIGALRSGAGLVSVIVPEKAWSESKPEHPPELMVLCPPGSQFSLEVSDLPFLLDTIKRRKITCLAIGMGLGQEEGISSLIHSLLRQTEIPVVLDADGLVFFKNESPSVSTRQIIATPHPGEYEAYFRRESESTEISGIMKKAKDLRIQLVYKSTSPLVTDGDSSYIIPHSYSSLAKAGSGDVLAGILASFIAQGYGDEAPVLGVWVHNQIGRELAEKGDSYSCTASDIAGASREVFRRMSSK